MVYCVAADVRLIIHTDLVDTDIEKLVVFSDEELDQKLGGASLSTDLKKNCSMMLTAMKIAERTPEAYSIGSVRMQHGKRAVNWRRSVNKIVARAVGRWDVVDPLVG